MATSADKSRAALLQELDTTIRKIGAQSVLISQTVADRVGLNPTDLECLDLLYMAGPTTAGTLAVHTGLTTGAMTVVLDRLERAGFVRRRRDARDRRRVLVETLPSSVELIQPFYTRLAAEMGRLHTEYNNQQLALVMNYMSRALELGADHVAWLQAQSPVKHRRGRRVGRARVRHGHRRKGPEPAGAVTS